jgi:RNA polymerase sigma-70 factor (ECF subfamily)
MSIRLDQSASTAEAAGPAAATPAELDEALLREIARGNQLAMRTLFMRHQVRVFRFVLRMIRDRTLAEDVVSEVFLAVWRQADRFGGRSSVSTWLLSIARHKALTAIKPQRVEALDPEMADAIIDPNRNPEAEFGEKDSGEIIRQCLGALSSEHSEIIDLVYYQQKSIKECADIIGIPLSTVKTRMFYARKRLATLLAAAGVDRGRRSV